MRQFIQLLILSIVVLTACGGAPAATTSPTSAATGTEAAPPAATTSIDQTADQTATAAPADVSPTAATTPVAATSVQDLNGLVPPGVTQPIFADLPPATPDLSGFPFSIENCGVTTTYNAPPERVITVSPTFTEYMLALGLADRQVGATYAIGPVLPEFEAAYAQIPALSEAYPPREVWLSVQPDFIYGATTSFVSEYAGTRDELQALGINTYLITEECTEGPVTVDAVYTDLRNMGRIFGMEARAEAVVQRIQQQIDDVQSRASSFGTAPRVFFYDSGEQVPFTAGSGGMASWAVKQAGGEHLFDDVEELFAEVSWETVVERDPEIILIIDYGTPTGPEKRAFLLNEPRLANVTAIKNQQIYIVPFEELAAGVRPGLAVQRLARIFHPEAFE